ncbi:MAG: type III pantothenate kinase [Fimbriimonadaceae bacterium]|nr:type III pantothenate kinase [Chthonomonadaceae bacterium]MCO5295291.1 type III pantothenate kinase [Fimbriimonadaceae bacterium]
MLWAIDVGNTHTVVGLWDGDAWRSVWRRSTDAEATEDELAAWIKAMCELDGVEMAASGVVCASVVPAMHSAIARLGGKWLGSEPRFLDRGDQVGLVVTYDPPHAVGADRLANALGALDRFEPPIVVVDFGTATTFDAIDRQGAYVGGAILTGIEVSSQALFGRTAKLPQVELVAPERAIGRTTVESLQSGLVLGYAGAIDTLAARMSDELGGARVLATGGLGSQFAALCAQIASYEPHLTLDGLRIAFARFEASTA